MPKTASWGSELGNPDAVAAQPGWPSPLAGILPEGRSLVSNTQEKQGIFVNHVVNGPTLLPLKTNKQASHAEMMAYSGGVQSSLLC